MRRHISSVVAFVVFAVLAWGVTAEWTEPGGLVSEARASLDRAGARNPVTAVLLSYRGYDTLLEVGVLLLAIASVWSLRRVPSTEPHGAERPLLGALLELILPLVVVAGGYLLWIGSDLPGGAFQGGALIAGGLVLARLRGAYEPRDGVWLRLGLVAGLLVFVGVAAGTLAAGGRLLEYPEGRASSLILLIEGAAVVSIALTLGAMYLGGRPDRGSDEP